MDLISESILWLMFLKVLASRMILASGMLRKYVERLYVKKKLFPNFVLGKSVYMRRICLFLKLMFCIAVQILPPNLKLTFLLWCFGCHFCTDGRGGMSMATLPSCPELTSFAVVSWRVHALELGVLCSMGRSLLKCLLSQKMYADQ